MDIQLKAKLVLLFICFSWGADVPVLEKFLNHKKLFSFTTKNIPKEIFKTYRYKWMDNTKSALRSYRKVNSYLGYKVYESVISFRKGELSGVELYYYSRGENGYLSEEKYHKLLTAIKAKIDSFAQGYKKRNKKYRTGLAAYTWENNQRKFILEGKKKHIKSRLWEAQYIKFTLLKSGGKQHEKQYASGVKKNIVTKPNGDIYIDNIPMVNQGAKGYCVVAAVTRVLKYYGRKADQYELADLFNTSNRGTSAKDIEKALRIIIRAKGISLQKIKISQFPTFYYKDLTRFLKTYNRYAPRKIDINDISPYYNNVIQSLRKNEKSFVKARLKTGGGNYRSFIKTVKSSVKKAKPVLWIMQLGFVREKENPQAYGGHMRLIIGYNDKEKKIFYTDTWGKGHEFKSMSYQQAYAVSVNLFLLSL